MVRDPSTAIVRWLLQKHACLLFAVIIELIIFCYYWTRAKFQWCFHCRSKLEIVVAVGVSFWFVVSFLFFFFLMPMFHWFKKNNKLFYFQVILIKTDFADALSQFKCVYIVRHTSWISTGNENSTLESRNALFCTVLTLN